MTQKSFFLFFFVSIANFSYATQFRQTKFRNFDIVFPAQIEQDIPKFLSHVEKIYSPTFFSFGKKSESIKIFLGNSSEENACVHPKGFFPLGKTKIYFFNYDFFVSEYSTTLIHEMRHVAQFSYFLHPHREPCKLLSFATFDFSMLMEGDAVLTETLLTNEGRGRDPFFLLYEKVKFLNDDEIKYANLLYRNWYTIGYLFCTHIRKNYGVETFRKLFERKNWYDDLTFFKGYKNFRILTDNIVDRFYPLSVNRRLKKFTGKNFSELFFAIKTDLKKTWNQQLENLQISEFEKVNKETRNYFNPQKFKDGIIALKVDKSEKEFTHFVFLKDGKEQWLKKFNFLFYNANFSCAQNKIIFRGNKTKLKNSKLPRHLKEADNAIFIFDEEKKSVKVIDEFPHCKNPIFSHDAKKIIFFSPEEDGTPMLVLLDGENFKILKRYKLEKFHLYKSLTFSQDDKKILFIDSFDGECCIKVVSDEEIKEIYRSKHILRGLAENEKFIFFGSSFCGIDNIYALEKESKKIFQITSSKYGAYRPHVIDDHLVYNDYNADCCYDIAKIKIDTNQWTPIEFVEDRNIYLFDNLQNQEEESFTTREIWEQVPVQDYEIKNYKFPLWYRFFSQPKASFHLSKKISADPVKNFLDQNFYDTWIGIKFFDYYSGISFWTKYKGNYEHDLLNIGIGYTLFDIHGITFETTILDHQKSENRFFDENILGYNFILEDFIGKNSYFVKPGIKVCLKNKKDVKEISCFGNINFKHDTYCTVNVTNFAFEGFNFYCDHNFNFSFDKKNSIAFEAYGFKIDKEKVENDSLLLRTLDKAQKVSIIKNFSTKSLSRKQIESIKDFRQFGFSFGYKYLFTFDYSLENWDDALYFFLVKSLEIFPEIKVDIPMFCNNEYSLFCHFDLSVLRNIAMHMKFGVMMKDKKISVAPFDFSFNLNLF